MTLTGFLGDHPMFLLDVATRVLRVAILIAIWRMLPSDPALLGGMTLPRLMTYTLAAHLFIEPINAGSGLEDAFWDGSIASCYLQPLGLVEQFAPRLLGRWLFFAGVVAVPLLAMAPALGVDPRPASAAALWAFPLSLLLAITVFMAMDLLAAAIMVRLNMAVWLIYELRASAGVLLSGELIPLELMPPRLAGFFQWMPFAALASTPLRIYTGTGPIALLLASQAAWSVVLWLCASQFFLKSGERIVSYGG